VPTPEVQNICCRGLPGSAEQPLDEAREFLDPGGFTVDRQVQEIDRRIHGSRRKALPKGLDKQQVGNRVLHFESGTQVLMIL